MKFKYSEKIEKLGISNCPPSECNAIESDDVFYRWIHENLDHKDNFIPVLEISPKRIGKPKFNTNIEKCSGFALSMHNNIENSRNHFYNVLADVPNFFQIVGSHVAELKISTNDGYRTIPSQNSFDIGHFDFFEQNQINWIERVSNISKIKNEQ